WTPLMLATIVNGEEIAKILIAHGADVTMTNRIRWTALDFATQRHYTNLVEILRQAMDKK
ncbi:MAG: ankyrin repeat domain-containing protein, partial [Verrucomicrobia bacterium]|nr:ankyrin repeat domain-containing protein [Verrucomicrobiota bacterium]